MRNQRSPKVFYSSYRPPQPSVKQPGQMRQMLIVAVIIIGGYFLTRLPVFQIQHIELEGPSNQLVENQLNELLGESLLSASTANKVKEIMTSNISILDLHCDKGIPNTLRCSMALRQPSLVWQSGRNRYLIDKEGYAFAKADSDTDLKILDDRKKLKVELGDQLMSEEVVGIFTGMAKELEDVGVEVDQYFINTSVLHPGVVASRRSGNKPFPKQKVDIYFSASYPIKNQVEILTRLLESSSNKIKEYVDLRTAGYIYYK